MSEKDESSNSEQIGLPREALRSKRRVELIPTVWKKPNEEFIVAEVQKMALHVVQKANDTHGEGKEMSDREAKAALECGKLLLSTLREEREAEKRNSADGLEDEKLVEAMRKAFGVTAEQAKELLSGD